MELVVDTGVGAVRTDAATLVHVRVVVAATVGRDDLPFEALAERARSRTVGQFVQRRGVSTGAFQVVVGVVVAAA